MLCPGDRLYAWLQQENHGDQANRLLSPDTAQSPRTTTVVAQNFALLGITSLLAGDS